MYIQPNKLLPPSSRIIRAYQSNFLATEGPNILSKLDLGNVQIPFESQSTVRMVLNPQSSNQPIMYGGLGNDITFLLLKITYDETDSKCQTEEEQYISYWLEGEPNIIRYAHKLMLLTGNSSKRIPQIYLNNPSDYTVYVDILMANLEQSDTTSSDVTNQVIDVIGLYYNNVLSDTYWNTSESISGSTTFRITDITDTVQVEFSYDDIITYSLDTTNYDIIITTTGKTITLDFLNEFEMNQANSRMLWVMSNPTTRYLTSTSPSVDITPPVFTMQSGATPTTVSGSTYIFPVTRDGNNDISITPSDVLNYFISGITDNRDGVMSVSDATVELYNSGQVSQISSITSVGEYDVVIYISDNATNKVLGNYSILVDDVAPEIFFITSKFTGTTFNMSIPEDTKVEADGITKDDIIRETVNYVTDSVDGTIPNSSIVVTISGDTGITSVYDAGQYNVNYAVTDTSNNTATYDRTMVVAGSIFIISGETYVLGDAITATTFVFVAPSTGDTASIVISGETNIIASSSGGSFVWDLGGLDEYTFTIEGESTSVVIQGSNYTITYNSSGTNTFRFTIDKLN